MVFSFVAHLLSFSCFIFLLFMSLVATYKDRLMSDSDVSQNVFFDCLLPSAPLTPGSSYWSGITADIW